jgi:hypothetical protein
MQAEIAAREAEASERRVAVAVRNALNLSECGNSTAAPTAAEILAMMLKLLNGFNTSLVHDVLGASHSNIMSDLTSAVSLIRAVADAEAATAISNSN